MIEKQWFSEKPSRFGSIVFMATGSGKTFVAIMLILKFFGFEPSKLIKMSDKQLQTKKELIQEKNQHTKKVAFLVPTTNLVEQQAEAINRHTELRVGKYSGHHQKSQKMISGELQNLNWKNQLETFDVFVFTEKKLYDTLMHGFIKIEDFDMIVFDECHHADQSHYYNLIMTDFFFYKYSSSMKRPRILGLTASPIKQKIGDCFVTNVTSEINEKLQNLANNLYSKFVCISPEQIQQLESQQVSVKIEKYDFDLGEKVSQINQIASNLIMKMCELIPVDQKTMSLNDPGNTSVMCDDPDLHVRESFDSSSFSEKMMYAVGKMVDLKFREEQDEQVVKFLKKRYEFINIDMKYIKTNIDVNNFKDPDDQVLLIFSIILLKNANNLILELGPYSFMRFLSDIKDELISKNSEKIEKARSIISDFTLFDEENEMNQVLHQSKKVGKLIDILNEYALEPRKPKVIIFVKDRIVAEYLKKILQQQLALKDKKEYENHPQRSKLLNSIYKVDMAMGPQGRNQINKAVRSTKTQSSFDNSMGTQSTEASLGKVDAFIDDSESNLTAEIKETFRHNVKNSSPSVLSNFSINTGKMTNNQLKEVLSKFRQGRINVLIATNVVEEGLDVSECNLVICMNELLNVKAFIQMKGRARQQDSNFIFLCANQEYNEVEKDRKNFGVVIDQMKELAFGKDSIGGIEPDPNIIEMKTVAESEFFEIPQTGARVSLRDAKSVLDVFCKAAAEVQPYVLMGTENPEAALRKPSKYVMDFEPNYHSKETTSDENNKKYFLTALYVPKTCGLYFNYIYRVMCENGFIKKRDSENHVALMALRQLYDAGYLDDYLFPRIGSWAQVPKVSQQTQPGGQGISLKKKKNEAISSAGHLIPSNTIIQRKKAQISEREMEDFKNEQKDFEKNLKNNKSRQFETVEASFRSLIKEQLVFREQKLPKIYIHCLKGQKQTNGFPFQNSSDHLGILFDRNFDQTNSIRFWMFQEKKQKDKNKEYLNQLLKNEIIDQNQYNSSIQDKDIIELELNKTNMIELDFNKQYANLPREEALKHVNVVIQKLKFFHTWIFYYFYCADHKFIKHILKNRFTFAQPIFGQEIKQIFKGKNTLLIQNIKQVYSPNLMGNKDKFDQKYKSHQQASSKLVIHPFIVPIIEENGELKLNWKLIEQIIKYIRDKIHEVLYIQKSRETIYQSLNLDPVKEKTSNFQNSQFAQKQDLMGIWDDKFTGVRYVKLEKFNAAQRWEEPILHLENRSNLQNPSDVQSQNPSQGLQMRNLISNFQENSQQKIQQMQIAHTRVRKLEFQNKDVKLDIYTVQQYNFDKNGLFLNPLTNSQLHVVRKERHFVDFSKTPKQQESYKQLGVEKEKQVSVSSKFDVPEQLLQKSPLSYDQYQVFQQSCTHLLYFNEFLQVEKFIRDKFKNLKCFLQVRDSDEKTMQLQVIQDQNNLSIDQRISQFKENLQSAFEPAKVARNVFMSPTQNEGSSSAEDQLLNNIDLVMEALTAPNANRNYDYERLEFYGDSVISFLVILELFLTKNYAYKEGPLDFYRIQQVSNMKFYKINLEHHFYKYMINEPQTIFNDFVPGAFENLPYQERIKHKTLNELNNKIKELRKLEIYVNYLIKISNQKKKKMNFKDQQFVDQLRRYYEENWMRRPSSFANDQIYKEENAKNFKMSKMHEDLQVLKEYAWKIRQCIDKIQTQKIKKIQDIEANLGKIHNKRQGNQKMFFFKQLADVVESVTGAATVACGLNLTQNYLKSIGVLNVSQDVLADKLADLKSKKEDHPEGIAFVHAKYNENNNKMAEVERTINYVFKNKVWLVEALTHKSYMDSNKQNTTVYENLTVNESIDQVKLGFNEKLKEVKQIDEQIEEKRSHQIEYDIDWIEPNDDYERLEFLGDAILNFLIAEHFYTTTVNDKEKKMPKELHKMKTSVINNALLSLIVIENGIHSHVLYNNKALSFKEQFDKYVSKVHELLAMQDGGCTKDSKNALDLDQLYEYNLKIFGDVFESIIGAVFLDSQCIDVTWGVLFGLMEPYIKIYANLQTLQDHSRTKLLELWNQKPFMRNLKCRHETLKHGPDHPNIPNDGTIVFRGMVDNDCVLEVPFLKDAKNKVRIFYKKYYHMMSGFFTHLEKKGHDVFNRESIVKKINDYRDNHYKAELLQEEEEPQQESVQINSSQIDSSQILDSSLYTENLVDEKEEVVNLIEQFDDVETIYTKYTKNK